MRIKDIATVVGQVEFEWLDQERNRRVRFRVTYRIDPDFEPEILSVKATDGAFLFRDDGSSAGFCSAAGCEADFRAELERDELLAETLNIECRRAAGVSE